MIPWNETALYFSRVTDKLGKSIDTGIFETVVALNLLGIVTRQSCEGHLNWGAPYPWVDIEADIDQKFRLHCYLRQFYTDRSTDFDCVLVFRGYRLESRGAAFYELQLEEERRIQLPLYQKEMSDFTRFLKSLLGL